MKQYTTPEQTAKLIELGLPKPKSIWALSRNCPSDKQLSYESSLGLTIRVEERFIPEYAYSIGELIEMLPESASQRLRYVATKRAWIVDVDMLGKQGKCHRGIYYAALIDALYEMVIKLKEEGVNLCIAE